ncbi:MAG: ABC transporter permease [Clostridiales bacterium]|jgi:hypothetical protein|nr:ABC transporter permease [Clostridiales bacterium]
MKKSDLFGFALYNIGKKRKSYLRVLFNFLLIFTVIFSVWFYSGGLSDEFDSFLNENAGYNRILIKEEISATQLDTIRGMPEVSAVIQKKRIWFVELALVVMGFPIEIPLDFNMEYYLTAVSSDGASISPNFWSELKYKRGENVIVAGRDVENENEFIASEELFRAIDIDYNDWLGKTVNLRYGSYESYEYYNTIEVTLVGVINSNISSAFEDYCIVKMDGQGGDIVNEVSLLHFKDAEKILHALEGMFSEDTVEYIGEEYLSNIKFFTGQQTFCNSFLSMVCVILSIVFLLNTINNQYYLFRKNSEYFGIMKAQGVHSAALSAMVFAELFFVLLLSGFFSFWLALGAFKLVSYMFSVYLWISVSLTPKIILGAIGLGVGLCLAFSFGITLFMHLAVLRKKTAELLKRYY